MCSKRNSNHFVIEELVEYMAKNSEICLKRESSNYFEKNEWKRRSALRALKNPLKFFELFVNLNNLLGITKLHLMSL